MSEAKLALITGGSKGLGKTLAEWFSVQGYHLILTARTETTLQATADALRTSGAVVKTVVGDIRDATHQAQIAALVAEHGRLDVLVNNASTLGVLPMPKLAHFALEDLREVFNVNVFAPVALVQQVLPSLKVAQGLVINLSSDAARGGYQTWGGYGASKAALELISATFANELAEDGVAVVSVDPGDMRTDMHQDAFAGEDISDRPLPDVTLPFWGWLLGQDRADINGKRFQAQSQLWEVTS